ncbi:hypothetical protein [Ruminococcus sp. HUN007]|uniref:hypothetical protein n=1 Tax=Ruminococcus sp. HUN007 TaxID=1514668 RepID=UPI0005D272D5|nr:hypothetical protein [Ruminococcus sp. HUN007]
MSPEELVIEILLRRATVKGELTEEEICNICEERNIAYAKTSYIIEKLMSKGVRIISTNYGNSYGKKNSRKSSYNLKTSRSDYQFDSAKTESISNSLSSDNDIASDDTIVNLYSEKAYADCMPTYLKYKNEVFYLNNWKDVYVKVMSLLAYRYDSKLASWAGFGDIFRIKDLPSDYSEDNFKPISRDIYIKTDYNTEELLFKIRKYINVCNADIKDIVIGCKKNTDVNAEHEKKKSVDDGKSLINEETKTTADNISDLPTEKVHISETEINTIPAKTEVKQSEIKPVSKTSDSIIKCVSSINDSFSATISKLKKAASEIIECEDHEKAVTVFSEIHSNICSLNAIKNYTRQFFE